MGADVVGSSRCPTVHGVCGGLRWAYRDLRSPLLYHSITLYSHCPRGESKRLMIISGVGLQVCGTLFSIIQSPCTRFVRARGRTNRLMLAAGVFGGGWGRFGIGSALRGAIVDGVCGRSPMCVQGSAAPSSLPFNLFVLALSEG